MPSSINKKFEDIKKLNTEGIEYWDARELIPLLGYDEWRNFKKVIIKAQESCKNSHQTIKDHFVDANKMIIIAAGTSKETTREIEDYKLSRYACYLIAQNGDPRKIQIATAQTYFAVQTRKQEITEQLTADQKRLFIRKEVKDQNKKLFDTAHKAGVNNFGKFNNYGYLGLYGLITEDIKKKKGIGKDDILDRAGSTELAANLFRITQTDEKILNEKIAGEERANVTHFDVGQKVRKTIEEIGGTMPEQLEPEKHIKEIEKVEKKMLRGQEKKRLKIKMKYDIHKVGGIIIKDKKLLVERSKNKEFFIAPGGSIEKGESAKQALTRELREEFAIQTAEEDFEEFGIFYAKAAGTEDKIIRMDVFVVKDWSGEPMPSSEVEEILWIISRIPETIKVGSIFEHEVIPRLKARNLIN